ncbi:MAG: hypothetical protein WDZ29_00970 [Balneolaceae bacterium]
MIPDSNRAIRLKPAFILIGLGLVVLAGVSFFIPSETLPAVFTGYLCGFSGVFLHLIFVRLFRKVDDARLLRYFLVGISLRFLIVLALFTLVFLQIESGKISFTFSFLVSYIYHFVIDIIFMHRNLLQAENRSTS